jgi:hypothetical protein
MGFAQEMKDFLSGWSSAEKIKGYSTDKEYKEAQTDALKKKTENENDPETRALETEKARADISRINAATGSSGASTAYTHARIKALNENQARLRDADGAGSGLVAGMPGVTPAGSGGANAGALPVPVIRNTMQTDPDELPAYAEGGLVEDDGSDDEEPDASTGVSAGAIPSSPTAAAPATAPTDISAARRQPSLDGVVSPQLVRDAARSAMQYGTEAFGLNTRPGAIRTRTQKLQAQQFASGTGGMTPKEMDAVRKTVDPEGKLTESQRNMAALGAVYQYQVNKGNPEGAQKLAFGMLQHFRLASQRYAAIAAHAAQEGDMDLATTAAVKAYANVPDGKDLAVFKDEDGKLNYSFTDENGKTIVKGIATPQQLAASAMGLASGGFDKALMQAAGQPAAAAGKDPNAIKPSEAEQTKKIAELSKYVGKAKEAYAATDEGKAAAKTGSFDEHFEDIHDFGAHLIQDNPRAQPHEVFKATMALNKIDPEDPSKQPFKVVDSSDDGMHTLKIDGGLKMKVNDDQLEVIMNKRAALLKAGDARQDANQDAEETPGTMERVGKGVLDLGGAIKDAVTDKTLPKELPGRYATGHGAVQRQETPLPPRYRSGHSVGALPVE